MLQEMTRRKELHRWASVVALVLFLLLVGCGAYVRLGTTIIGDFVSPDGRWDAVLIVRNGGAMTGYATAISIVSRGNPAARQIGLFRPNLFVADDNDGAVRWGDRGQIDVKVSWASSAQLVVTYPEKARICRQDPSFRSVSVRYVTTN